MAEQRLTDHTINTFLLKNVETPLIEFFKGYRPGGRFSVNENGELRKSSREIEYAADYSYVRCLFPRVQRDSFGEHAGYRIEKKPAATGEVVYLGNFSIEVRLAKNNNRVLCSDYSYKFWFSDSKYTFITGGGEECGKETFHFRLEKDPSHGELKFHTSMLHSWPRIESVDSSVPDFLSFLEKNILPATEGISLKTWRHVAQINNIKDATALQMRY